MNYEKHPMCETGNLPGQFRPKCTKRAVKVNFIKKRGVVTDAIIESIMTEVNRNVLELKPMDLYRDLAPKYNLHPNTVGRIVRENR